MKHSNYITTFTILLIVIGSLLACQPGKKREVSEAPEQSSRLILADQLEESLFEFIVNPWYPLAIDTLNGGYHSEFTRDWSPGSGSGEKALVQQARHIWTSARLYEAYPELKEFQDYARHGFLFLKDLMWDKEYGGFHAYCSKEGAALMRSLDDKRIYGQAFAVYGLSQYYKISKNPEALELAKKTFLWMEEHAHDKEFGGYFELLRRDGTPVLPGDVVEGPGRIMAGLKDYNSSIHLMEAFTELYLVWPDELVRKRLEEMFLLIRDTFVHPDGYLQLYFRADWTHVSPESDKQEEDRNNWFFEHFTYGHDVETAFLLLETAHVLEWEEDEKTHHTARQLVDHSLASGWDSINGGFFDAGLAEEEGIRIVNNHKSWWGLVEGMNALLLMHTLYPEDSQDYYALFLKSWGHIDTYLIDKEYGGWYNAALDTAPESKTSDKSHIWKTTYHNVRGMINCTKMLRSINQSAE